MPPPQPRNPARSLGWSQVWHMPVLLLGLASLGAGMWLGLPTRQANDFPAVLAEIEDHIANQQFDQAAARLDTVAAHLGDASPQETARHWALRADLVYLQQRALGADLEANHRRVLECYANAEAGGLALDADRLQRLARTLAWLDRVPEALAVLERLRDQPARSRYGLVRMVIEAQRARPGRASAEDLTTLLERFEAELHGETDLARRRPEAIWAVSIRGQCLLEADQPQQAIDLLDRQIQRLAVDGPEADLAPLFLLLAQAQQQVGDVDEARRYYVKTQALLAADDMLQAQVLVGLGELDVADPDRTQDALDQFERVVTDFPDSPAQVAALLGQGDCEAKLGQHAAALVHLGNAAEQLAAGADRQDPRLGQLERIVHSHHALNFDKQAYEVALGYLSLLPPLHAEGPPPGLLLSLAMTHERLAQQRRARTEEAAQGHGDGDPPSPEDRAAAFQDAATHFAMAAAWYRQHADATTISDDAAHGQSLWKAAECYDKAQRWDEAIQVYTQFVKTRESDEFYLEAIRRLGLAYMATGQHAAAAERFKYLIEQKPRTQAAYESLVPLARCHLALGEWDQARQVLVSVVDNHESITPDSLQYRIALVELGKLHHQRGQFPEAISRFRAAVDRYVRGDQAAPDDEAPMLLFHLAEALRRSVVDLAVTADQPRSAAAEQVAAQERSARLTEAQGLYGEVLARLEERDPGSLTAVEELTQRNACFYVADCAYELHHWDEAIALYDAAAKRWEKHPASLVALVQIVNAHAQQGHIDAARIANDRARFQLSRIPDEAFDDPTLPMTRQHWQQWLRWTSELDLFGAQARAAPGAP